MNKLSLALAASLLPVSAHALGLSESLWAGASGFETAVEAAQPSPAVDAFAGVPACAPLERRHVRAIPLDEAEELAAPCIAAVLAKYQAAGEIKRGFLAESADGEAAPAGLLIRTDLALGSQGLRDLELALSSREERILGHRVRVLRQGEAEPASASALQEALAQCITPTVVRDIRTGDDFLRVYGRCLERNRELKIKELRAGPGLSVVIETEAEQAQLQAYNGFVTVNAGKGPVRVMVQARAARAETPAVPAAPAQP